MEGRFERIEKLLKEANEAIKNMMDGQSMEFKVLVPLLKAVEEMSVVISKIAKTGIR